MGRAEHENINMSHFCGSDFVDTNGRCERCKLPWDYDPTDFKPPILWRIKRFILKLRLKERSRSGL